MPSLNSFRTSERKRTRNQPLRTRAKTFVTRARRAMAAGDTAAAEQAVRDAVVALDKAAQRGAIHPNNAARRKSRIMRQLHQSKSSEG